MISPDEYYEHIKELPYVKLIKERNKLFRNIHRFENCKESESGDVMIVSHPSEEVVYQCNNIYLIKITEVIMESSVKGWKISDSI